MLATNANLVSMKVLIIEDDPTLNNNIKEALRAENINSESVFDGQLAERILKTNSFDCVIMDINLPGQTGYNLCKNFRNFNTHTPVLMLTAFSELEDKVKGYDCGADDYLTKPFFMRELILRVNSLVKRSKNGNTPSPSVTITANDVSIHPSKKEVYRQGKEIKLTPREYQILLKLVEQKGEVISKNELIEEIWGTSFDTNTNTVEVYINFLRKKIDKPFNKNSIQTKIGYGYYWQTE